MQYLGGKSRIAARLVDAMAPLIRTAPAYYEPFVGAAWVLARVQHPRRYASDANAALVAMWQALQAGWTPPTAVTASEHAAALLLPDTDPRKAFIRFGCSFGGDWRAGFANVDKRTGITYAAAAARSLAKKLPGVQSATFTCASYDALDIPSGAVVYCDPPYAGATQYGAVGDFDSAKFWAWCRTLDAHVFVSEYDGPPDFALWDEIPTATAMHGAGRAGRFERLFYLSPKWGRNARLL